MMKSVLLRNNCGCLVTRTQTIHFDVEQIEYCPKHAAAPDLLEALDCFLQDYHSGNNLKDAADKASVAIIQAAPPANTADATLEKE